MRWVFLKYRGKLNQDSADHGRSLVSGWMEGSAGVGNGAGRILNRIWQPMGIWAARSKW